jgi:hypothetical protein
VTRRLLAVLFVGAVLSAGPGCSTAVPGSAAAAPAPPVARPEPSPSRSPAPTAGPAPGAPAHDLRPLLLTAQEVGPGFTPSEDPVPDPDVPAVCGGPGVVAVFPDAVRAGAAFDLAGRHVEQTASGYPDTGTARAAYREALDGLDCGEGTAGGQPVVLTPAEDLTFDVGGDEAAGKRIGNDLFDAVVIVARSGRTVTTFTVLAAAGHADGLPDPLVIARTGVQKLG